MRRDRFGTTREQVCVVLEDAGFYGRFGVGFFRTERRVAVTVVGRDSKPPPRILAGTGCRFYPAGETESVLLKFECVQQRGLVVDDIPKGNPLQSLTVTLLRMYPNLIFSEGGAL